MKFTRFSVGSEHQIRSGVLVENTIKEMEGNLFGTWQYTGVDFFVNDVKLKAPLVPNSIIGIGANFVAAKEDLAETLPEIPVFFYKPVTSVIGPDDQIEIPLGIDEVKFESELAIIIGKETRDVSEEEALDYVFGCTVGNDVTAPQYFHPNGHWMVGKSFNTFTPLGPVIETDLNPLKARIEALHNGTKKQDSSVDLMIIPIPYMISYLSKVMTLLPGDVILTGSPVGADFLRDGDTIECKIEEIGILRNVAVKSNLHF